MLALLGPRINSVRVMPKRIVEGTDEERGFWWRWSHFVMRRPLLPAASALPIVALLMIPAVQLNATRGAGKGSRRPGDRGRRHRASATDRRRHHTRRHQAVRGAHRAQRIARGCETVAERLDSTEGLAGAGAPRGWQRGETQLVEAFPTVDSAARSARGTIDDLQSDVLPELERELGGSTRLTLGGTAPEDRDFVHAVYGKFPLVLAFVILLTLVLLMRAFRSVFLAVKAVILNLLSLGAAFGIIVFIFQQGHGSEAIWDVHATDAIISWIPLMIFAFLYGLSMDYEVFMVSRMREAYDETGDTKSAIALGPRAHGKARDECGVGADVRVLRPLYEPGRRREAVRDRARGGDHLRRDGDPCAARAVDHARGRRLELVAARVGGQGATRACDAAAGAREVRLGRLAVTSAAGGLDSEHIAGAEGARHLRRQLLAVQRDFGRSRLRRHRLSRTGRAPGAR